MSNTANNRIIYYYRTQYYNNQYISFAANCKTFNPIQWAVSMSEAMQPDS